MTKQHEKFQEKSGDILGIIKTIEDVENLYSDCSCDDHFSFVYGNEKFGWAESYLDDIKERISSFKDDLVANLVVMTKDYVRDSMGIAATISLNSMEKEK